jgi:hypothetical protein
MNYNDINNILDITETANEIVQEVQCHLQILTIRKLFLERKRSFKLCFIQIS